MASLLDHCRGFATCELEPGALLLHEGEPSGRLFVLAQGTLSVHRGEVEIALVTEPGAVFSEMSVRVADRETVAVGRHVVATRPGDPPHAQPASVVAAVQIGICRPGGRRATWAVDRLRPLP